MIFDSISELSQSNNLQDGELYYVARYGPNHKREDGSGGWFIYRADSGETIDDGHVFGTFDGGNSRIIRIDRSRIRVEQFGAVGDNLAARAQTNREAIQRAFQAATANGNRNNGGHIGMVVQGAGKADAIHSHSVPGHWFASNGEQIC